MEKIMHRACERVKTILITLLTVSMLVLAVIYIGGARFSGESTAIKTASLPEGAVALGEDAPTKLPIYQKDLLPVSFAGIRYGGKGGGAYGTEQAAAALFDFAAEPIHLCLAQGASLTAVSAADYAAAAESNFICLNFLTSLPYQMLYALTGELGAAAGSDTAISADRVLLSFTANGKATLYLSDGTSFYAADGDITVKPSELAAMANDSRLSGFTVSENGIALSSATPYAPKISLELPSLDAAQYAEVLTLLGYKSETGISAASAADDGFTGTAVAPHGTVHVGNRELHYTAARDSGIAISGFLDTAKSELDIDMYDILGASISLAEQLRAIAPEALGGEGKLFLGGFYREEDTFTVLLGLHTNGMEISGSTYPYFAKIKVQNGMFVSLQFRFAKLTKNSYTSALFPSLWQYNYAANSAAVRTLRLYYRADELPAKNLDAVWYFTGDVTSEEVAE
ncbi:MAG: hypothetical protein IJX64_06085 [Clostridia bacterium]|nr:hypothetical protein [Clostridia bacterium]